MASPFKMQPKSPMMKALVGKQHRLPDHLKKAIEAAPESPAKSYGSKKDSPMKSYGSKKKSPMMKDPGKKKKDNFRYESDMPEVIGTAYKKSGTERVTEYKPGGKTMKKGDTYERGGFQTPKKVVDTGRDRTGAKKAGQTGTVTVAVKKGDVRFTTGKKTKAKSPVKKTTKPMTAAEIKKNKETMDYRRGKGRADVTKKGSMVKGSESRRLGEGMAAKGTKKAGSAGTRMVKEGTTASGKRTGRSMAVVLEKPASQIKKRGVDLKKKKATAKSPAMMKGVKGLKKQRGKK